MKRFCFLFFAMALLSFVQGVAQDEGPRKPVVYVDYFYRDTIVNPVYADIVRDCVVTNLKGFGRIDIVDVDSIEELRGAREKCERGTLTFEEIEERYRQLSDAKADFVIKGIVNNIYVVEQPKDSCAEYSAHVTITLKIINVKTGMLVDSSTFNDRELFIYLVPQKIVEEAVKGACRRSCRGLKRFIESNFPLTGDIIEIIDGGKYLYINLGSADDVRRGDNFEVRKLRTIAGRLSSSMIGRLSVESVEGEHRSLAKVRSGGDEIKKYFNSGEEIVVIYYDNRKVNHF